MRRLILTIFIALLTISGAALAQTPTTTPPVVFCGTLSQSDCAIITGGIHVHADTEIRQR